MMMINLLLDIIVLLILLLLLLPLLLLVLLVLSAFLVVLFINMKKYLLETAGRGLQLFDNAKINTAASGVYWILIYQQVNKTSN